MRANLVLLGSALGSRFLDDVPKGSGCSDKLREIEDRFPGLNECFSYSSLYFGTTAGPCSEKCLDLTVQASHRVAELCQLEPPNAQHPILSYKERVYAVWGNGDAARAVCEGHGARGQSCLDEFSRVSSQLALPPRLRTTNAVTAAKACTPCTRELYTRFKDNGYLMPVVYYQTIEDPDKAFRNLGVLCGYN